MKKYMKSDRYRDYVFIVTEKIAINITITMSNHKANVIWYEDDTKNINNKTKRVDVD